MCRAVAAAAVACLIVPAAAAARNVYVSTDNVGTDTVTVIDTATNALSGSPIPVGVTPDGIAITPDGSRAYVADAGSNTVTVIDTATNSVVGPPIPIGPGTSPRQIAISPDGTRAYTANPFSGSVSIIDTAANAVIGSIPVPNQPSNVAITPDGSLLFVARNGLNAVSVIDLSTNAIVGAPISVGNAPQGITFTPDGTRAYVANNGFPYNYSVIDVAARTTIGMPIPAGDQEPVDIAITPDGTRAYLDNSISDVRVLDTATNTIGPVIDMPGKRPFGIAMTPDGSRVYTANLTSNDVSVIDTATNTISGPPIPLSGQGQELAIVPNQGPVATFTAVGLAASGSPVAFDAGGSSDSDGTVARYDWDFGDGTQLQDGGPTATHTYSTPGLFTVTLTVIDNEGCSTTFVFTGQTALCNGGTGARATRELTIDGNSPILELRGKRKQKPDGTIEVRANCGEACALLAKGKLLVSTPGGGARSALATRKFNLKQLTTDLDAGQRKLLRIGYSRRARAAATKALRNGGKVRVRMSVAATDAVGLTTTLRRRVSLKLP